MPLPIESQIEAILFFKSEPISIKELANYIGCNEEEIQLAISELSQKLLTRGVQVVYHENKVMLGTHPEASALIEKITKEELSKDLGKAGLETLSIILYKGPISRRDVDYIRGVNSSFIIRNLLMRGLIERTDGKEGERSYTYTASFELLNFLGIKKVEELPEFEQFRKEIEEFKKQNGNEQKDTGIPA